jgi:hypothetical protein
MTSRARMTVATVMATAVLVPAATAYAEPSPQTPQESPQTPQGQSSPQTPQAAPPAPSAPEYSGPVSPGSPGIVPGPPSTPQVDYSEVPQAPSYSTPYNPAPSSPLHAPRPTPPQPRKSWKPNTLTIGNIEVPVTQLPKVVQDNPRWIVSTNDWADYGASEIARALISVGVPKDEATRKAAATIVGVVAGGVVGGTVAMTGTAIVVGVVTIPLSTLIGTGIGAGIGAAMPLPAPGVNAGPGALIGAGAGAATGVAITAAAAALAGTGGAVLGGLIGGGLAYALGAGDPGANKTAPDLPSLTDPTRPATPALPNPGAHQFEVHLPADKAAQHGLPAVDYVVTAPGDVEVSAQVGNQRVSTGWSAEQAQAPINALGPAAPAARKAINDTVRTASEQAAKAIPGLTASWPQLAPATGKHHR